MPDLVHPDFQRGATIFRDGRSVPPRRVRGRCLRRRIRWRCRRAGRGFGGMFQGTRGSGDCCLHCRDHIEKTPGRRVGHRPHRSGQRIYSKGDYDGATRDYDEAVQLNPKNSVAFYNRGNVYNRLGQYDDAIENYDRAIELRPDYANAFNNRCSAYTAKGAYDRAIEDCSRAIALDATRANFFVSRGNAYGKKHDYDRAMS